MSPKARSNLGVGLVMVVLFLYMVLIPGGICAFLGLVRSWFIDEPAWQGSVLSGLYVGLIAGFSFAVFRFYCLLRPD